MVARNRPELLDPDDERPLPEVMAVLLRDYLHYRQCYDHPLPNGDIVGEKQPLPYWVTLLRCLLVSAERAADADPATAVAALQNVAGALIACFRQHQATMRRGCEELANLHSGELIGDLQELADYEGIDGEGEDDEEEEDECCGCNACGKFDDEDADRDAEEAYEDLASDYATSTAGLPLETQLCELAELLIRLKHKAKDPAAKAIYRRLGCLLSYVSEEPSEEEKEASRQAGCDLQCLFDAEAGFGEELEKVPERSRRASMLRTVDSLVESAKTNQDAKLWVNIGLRLRKAIA